MVPVRFLERPVGVAFHDRQSNRGACDISPPLPEQRALTRERRFQEIYLRPLNFEKPSIQQSTVHFGLIVQFVFHRNHPMIREYDVTAFDPEGKQQRLTFPWLP